MLLPTAKARACMAGCQVSDVVGWTWYMSDPSLIFLEMAIQCSVRYAVAATMMIEHKLVFFFQCVSLWTSILGRYCYSFQFPVNTCKGTRDLPIL